MLNNSLFPPVSVPVVFLENMIKQKQRKRQPEYHLQKMVCDYLRLQYPEVLFLSDTVASVKLTAIQGARNKAIQNQGFKTPDLIILEPRGGYAGLFIELKVESPFKKDGTFKKDEHLEGQLKSINDLKRKGYYASFSWGFEMTKAMIDNYMKL